MEQEKETQATYHDRSVDELRHDIIIKAEEIAKEPKRRATRFSCWLS